MYKNTISISLSYDNIRIKNNETYKTHTFKEQSNCNSQRNAKIYFHFAIHLFAEKDVNDE